MASQRRPTEYKRRYALVKVTAKWAVTMTQVAIRRAVVDKPYPRWHFVKFDGKSGGESRGVVDLIAVRKDHSEPAAGTRRGDRLQITLFRSKVEQRQSRPGMTQLVFVASLAITEPAVSC